MAKELTLPMEGHGTKEPEIRDTLVKLKGDMHCATCGHPKENHGISEGESGFRWYCAAGATTEHLEAASITLRMVCDCDGFEPVPK
ncbi:unnamed protein product [marine sediment metagenome]|uniref:Uncharacterized protein n=1 Tax=marine sediment metagenome TaxID=412755 RepID=X0UWK0_9ZZZZ